jgi:DnaJ-class molecular chaperone
MQEAEKQLGIKKGNDIDDRSDDDNSVDNVVRGDVVVFLNIQSKQVPNVHIDTLFCKYDLHMEDTMTLYEYFYGINRKLTYFNNEELPIQVQMDAKNVKDGSDFGYFSCVKEVVGKGLPYVVNQGTEEESMLRGNLYIYFKLYIPLVDEAILSQYENFFSTYFNDVPSTRIVKP